MSGQSVAMRSAGLNAKKNEIGPGALLRIYTGVRPAVGAVLSGNTLLGEFTMGTPFAPDCADGSLEVTLPANVNALAAGTATWARIVKADGATFCMDLSVGTAAAEVILNTVTISQGLQLSVSAFNWLAGNAT